MARCHDVTTVIRARRWPDGPALRAAAAVTSLGLRDSDHDRGRPPRRDGGRRSRSLGPGPKASQSDMAPGPALIWQTPRPVSEVVPARNARPTARARPGVGRGRRRRRARPAAGHDDGSWSSRVRLRQPRTEAGPLALAARRRFRLEGTRAVTAAAAWPGPAPQRPRAWPTAVRG
jgi:hypothetical protein